MPTEPSIQVTEAVIDSWAEDQKGPVALHLKQILLPVEGKGAVIFPPTYADIGYNIDELSDGTKVATIDSVGSQANRMEPIFKKTPYSGLVPQIEIDILAKPNKSKGEKFEPYVIKKSLLDLAHRSADATILGCRNLHSKIREAFHALKAQNNALPLCCLAPTSLLFGVWDSRGGSGEKRPRIVRSIIRAWDIDPLHAAAQFNSIRKTLDEETWGELQKVAAAANKKLSDVGLDDAPAVFRKLKGKAATEIKEYECGSPNPQRRVLGGIVVRGPIQRDITINLMALRKLHGSNKEEMLLLRRYVLSLALLICVADIDFDLREGCNLYVGGGEECSIIPRKGDRIVVDLAAAEAMIMKYAETAVRPLKKDWPELKHRFEVSAVRELIKAVEVEDQGES